MWTIKNIKSIEELSKYDALIRNHALELCKHDSSLADDITNDMYIKLDSLLKRNPEKVFDGGYVSVTLRNLIKNNYSGYVNRFDWGDAEDEKPIPDKPDDFDENVKHLLYLETLDQQADELWSKLHWYEKKVYEYSEVMSMAEFARQSKIPYQSLIYSLNNVKDKLGIERKKHKKK